MSDKDVIDPDLRLRFAWRTAATLGDDPLAPPPPGAAPPAGATAEAEPPESTAEACAHLARKVARIWQMTPRRRQAAAVHRLLGNLECTVVGWMGMGKHPVEVMRLWRLGVRHARVLGKGDRRILWRMPIVVGAPEAVDFLVEVVESDDPIARVLDEMDVVKAVARARPALGARLAGVVEHGKTWAARERAVRWLVHADRSGAVEVSLRAIRKPLVRLRACALAALMEARPTAIAAEDVAWLLEDALRHPLPRGTGEGEQEARARYEKALLGALKACPPPEGWRAVEALMHRGLLHQGLLVEMLGPAWALVALAAGWPERALPHIDASLATLAEPDGRRVASVEATAQLPEALARPRLLEAAALPDHDAAELAKQRWFERFGEACPVSPLAGVRVDLLDGPPSDALLARLTVLRGASAEAAGAILGAALAEAPSREALVLLLYSLLHLGRAHEESGLEGFSDLSYVLRRMGGLDVWAKALLRRFGAPAFDGILALAAREARAGGRRGWLDLLPSLARKGVFDEAQRDRLRHFAAGLVDDAFETWRTSMSPSQASQVVEDACDLLAAVGVPPSSVERLFSIGLRPYEPEPENDGGATARAALSALGKTATPEIDARMLREAEAALASDNLLLVADLVHGAAGRDVDGILAIAAVALAAIEREPAEMAAAEMFVRALFRADRIGEKWFVEAFKRPSSAHFTVAAMVVPQDPGRAVVRALTGALGDLSRDGCAAAEAACALVDIGALPVTDPRLDGILERAPELARMSLVSALFREGAKVAPLARHCVSLLTSRDAAIAQEMFVILEGSHGGPDTWDVMEAAIALGPLPAIAGPIDRYIGAPSEAESYWRDLDDEDDEAS